MSIPNNIKIGNAIHISCYGQVHVGIDTNTQSQLCIKVSDITAALEHKSVHGIPGKVHDSIEQEILILDHLRQLAKKDARYGLFFPKPILAQQIDGNRHILVTTHAGMDLFDFMIHRKEDLSLDYIKQIMYYSAMSIQSLHEINIAHCDISLENLCFDENGGIPVVRVIDFGSSIMNHSKEACFFTSEYARGKIKYMSPECFQSNIDKGYNLYANDVYALAVTWLNLLFQDNNLYEQPDEKLCVLYRSFVQESSWKNAMAIEYPLDLISLLEKMLAPEAQRISMLQVLRDPYFHSQFYNTPAKRINFNNADQLPHRAKRKIQHHYQGPLKKTQAGFTRDNISESKENLCDNDPTCTSTVPLTSTS